MLNTKQKTIQCGVGKPTSVDKKNYNTPYAKKGIVVLIIN